MEKQSNNKEFIPQDETKYWQIYALDSIASQTFESIVSRARERIYKPEEFHYPDGIKHEQGRAERTLDLLEKESPNYIDTFNKKVDQGKVIAQLPPEEEVVVKQSKEASDNVQRIYEEKGI